MRNRTGPGPSPGAGPSAPAAPHTRATEGRDERAGAEPSHASAGFTPATPRAGIPDGLHVVERAPAQGWSGYSGPVVVFVHGSLDRAASFTRTALRLPGRWGLVAYDRRGYQRSREAPTLRSFVQHIDDLVGIAGAYRRDPGAGGDAAGAGARVTAVGHSVGGTIVLGAACLAPELFASVAVYEPSLPWLGFHPPRRPPPAASDPGHDPGDEAERFFRRMVGGAAWERLSEAQRAARRADGPALVAELRGIREGPVFDVTALSVPTLVAAGGPSSLAHHRQTVEWLAERLPISRRVEIPGAGHGGHLTHPDAFAQLVQDAVALGEDSGPR